MHDILETNILSVRTENSQSILRKGSRKTDTNLNNPKIHQAALKPIIELLLIMIIQNASAKFTSVRKQVQMVCVMALSIPNNFPGCFTLCSPQCYNRTV